ncbi:MAG: glycosyltransferase [Pyrinomonadaceae bacterium]|nr:glycosyltransferase [Pyrinomonadaceae bacterium]
MQNLLQKSLRVAFFPDSYLEINGAAMTFRKFTDFVKKRGYPFLCFYAGEKTEKKIDGNFMMQSLKHSPLSIPVDEGLKYDPLFNRHLKLIRQNLEEFKPDIIHLTGVNDVSITAAILSHQMKIPLIGSWHTNLHEFAARRLDKMFRFLPESWRKSLSGLAERLILNGEILYYKIPKVVLAPNQELIDLIQKGSGRDAFLMTRGVDSDFFSPAKRTVNDGILRVGFVGRLRAEKNVGLLPKLEQSLLKLGKTNFKFLIVGEGNEREFLEQSLQNAEFTGFVTGDKLAQMYANMDVFVFPSETDTFGNVVQEANCSGVPAIVSNFGGPKFVIKEGETGFIAKSFDDFVKYTVELMDNSEKLATMKKASRDFVISNSWDAVFDEVYQNYEKTIKIAAESEKN